MLFFLQAFGCFYLMNRIMLWWVHRHVEGGSQEMWRGSQMWVWISPNHIKAIWKVLVAENWLFKKLFAFEVSQLLCYHTILKITAGSV
jgi:hypothetical protein